MADKQRLFVDMDGTLAVFQPVDKLETLYEGGYFAELPPIENVVHAIRHIISNHPEIEVHILSAYLTDSPHALIEKNLWLDRYLPEIDAEHRIFTPCGRDKKEYIPGGIRETDCLLDDYTQNLNLWHPPGIGIKLLNGINHTRATWKNDCIRFDRSPEDLANAILSVMSGDNKYRDSIIKENSSGVAIPGHKGTWHTIDKTIILGKEYFLMEHDFWGDEVPNVVLDKHGELILNGAWNGFYDLQEYLADISHAQYHILQLRPGEDNRYRRFICLDELQSNGEYPDIKNYQLVYSAKMTADCTLDSIYEKFNLNPPSDFTGHSLSLSDIVVIQDEGKTYAYYVDTYGFTELQPFAEQIEKCGLPSECELDEDFEM